MKRLIFYLILAALLAVFIATSNFDFSEIFRASPEDVTLLGLIILLSYMNTFFAIKIQFRMLKVKEIFSNIAYLSLATNVLNYLPGKGGTLSLGTFLKVKKKVPFNKFVFTTMLIYMLVTAVTLLLSLIFIFDENMLFFYEKINYAYLALFVLFSITFMYISIRIAKKNPDNKISQYYLLFVSNRQMIRKNKLNLLLTTLVIIGGIVLFSCRMYFSFRIAGREISVYHSLMIGVIANLSFFLSFTPGGLGVKEGFVGGVSYLIFGDAGIGIIASLIDRTLNLILTLATGVASIRILDKRFFSKNKSET